MGANDIEGPFDLEFYNVSGSSPDTNREPIRVPST